MINPVRRQAPDLIPIPVAPGIDGIASNSTYIFMLNSICLELLMQPRSMALSLARPRAGNSKAARMAMMAMTTSSSIRVNPRESRGGNQPDEHGGFAFIKD